MVAIPKRMYDPCFAIFPNLKKTFWTLKGKKSHDLDDLGSRMKKMLRHLLMLKKHVYLSFMRKTNPISICFKPFRQ